MILIYIQTFFINSDGHDRAPAAVEPGEPGGERRVRVPGGQRRAWPGGQRPCPRHGQAHRQL